MFEERNREHGHTQLGGFNTAYSAASSGHQDELSRIVDLNAGKGAAGFIGKMSEITWIQRAWEYLLDPTVKMSGISPRRDRSPPHRGEEFHLLHG